MDIPNGSGLFGRVAIVTGGGARGEGIGNGRAGAILLAQEGAKVMVIDRLGSLAERTVEMITQNGGEAAAFAADITRPNTQGQSDYQYLLNFRSALAAVYTPMVAGDGMDETLREQRSPPGD